VGKLNVERQKVKSVLASGGFAPSPSDQGLYPWTLLEAAPRTPVYRGLTGAFKGPPTLKRRHWLREFTHVR